MLNRKISSYKAEIDLNAFSLNTYLGYSNSGKQDVGISDRYLTGLYFKVVVQRVRFLHSAVIKVICCSGLHWKAVSESYLNKTLYQAVYQPVQQLNKGYTEIVSYLCQPLITGTYRSSSRNVVS